MDKKYESILHRPWRGREQGPPMARSARAAQFAPFAALTGFEGVLAETARQTETAVELAEDEIARVNAALEWIWENLVNMPVIRLRFFVPDSRKSGGAYRTVTDRVEKMDKYRQTLTLCSGETVKFSQITEIIPED